MPRPHHLFNRSGSQTARDRAVRPKVEGLEGRLLLYSTLGGQWTYDSRITYSFMPDGTSVGGVPSALFQTLNANYPTATWQQQLQVAATLWENVTNVNLSLVADGGQAVGSSGNQQDDPRFGDIRIGAVPLPSGTLAETFVPPPINGGTDAGDILLNSNVNWQINSSYDLLTVVSHEFGHALGLGESTVSQAVMYGTYNGIKQSLVSDDIAGIQSIYGTRQFDQFNTGGHRDNTYSTATNINSYVGSNAQLAIPSLDMTTPGDSEWFFVNVPSTTSGTMTVTVQSSNLSSLAPKLQVYSSSLSLIGQVSAPNTFGATISVTASVQAGQGYYIKVLAAGGPGAIGAYGLLANFGSQSQPAIQPPNTVVPSQPDQGGGTTNDNAPWGGQNGQGGGQNGQGGGQNGQGGGQNGQGGGFDGLTLFQGTSTLVGNLNGWTDNLNVSSSSLPVDTSDQSTQPGDATAFGAVQIASNVDGAAAQGITQATTLVSASNLMAPATPTPFTAGPALTVLQALDEALEQWIPQEDQTAA
ncbi:MAG: matrixin family metalloprotease [Isosphaerales bacterium]